MHTFLITGQTQEQRLHYIQEECDKLKIKKYDIHQLIPENEALSIGISNIRQFQKDMSLAPIASPYIIGIIQSAELLTIEAQNSLLKLLEEPPKRVKIFMECHTIATLLPTILSRAHVVTLSQPIDHDDETSYKQMQTLMDKNTPIGQKMALIDTYITNTKDAKSWIKNVIFSLHHHQNDLPKTTYLYYMHALLFASKQLASNVSYKVVLDHIFIPKKH